MSKKGAGVEYYIKDSGTGSAAPAGATGTIKPQRVNVSTNTTNTKNSTSVNTGMAGKVAAALFGASPLGMVALGTGAALAGAANAFGNKSSRKSQGSSPNTITTPSVDEVIQAEKQRQSSGGLLGGQRTTTQKTGLMWKQPQTSGSGTATTNSVVNNPGQVLALGKGPLSQAGYNRALNAGKSDAEKLQEMLGLPSAPDLSAVQAPVILKDQGHTAPTPGNDPWVTGLDDYGETDYSVQLKQAMAEGQSASDVQKILDARTEKAERNGYKDYINDDLYWAATKYIADQGVQAEAVPDYDLSELIRKERAAELESALAGIQGAYLSGMAEYDAALEKLPQTYQAARNDAAAQSAMAQKNFDERAAASGLNSGASGQAALDASAAYRGAMAQLDQAQADAVAEIDRAKAALTAQYKMEIAQANADSAAELARDTYDEKVRVQGLVREDDQTAYDREQKELDREEKKRQEDETRALESATYFANQGDFALLGAYYNWSDAQVQWMNERYKAAKAEAEKDEAVKLAQFQADNMISGGIMPPAALLERAGYDEFYAKSMSEANAKLLAAERAGSSSGRGGGGYTGGGPTNDTLTYVDPESIYQMAKDQGGSDPVGWIKLNYKALGIPYNSINSVANGYETWLDGQKSAIIPVAPAVKLTADTFPTAVDFLNMARPSDVMMGRDPVSQMKSFLSAGGEAHSAAYTNLLNRINHVPASTSVNTMEYFTPLIEAAMKNGLTQEEANDLLNRVGNY